MEHYSPTQFRLLCFGVKDLFMGEIMTRAADKEGFFVAVG
jgi:hypothetical protein